MTAGIHLKSLHDRMCQLLLNAKYWRKRHLATAEEQRIGAVLHIGIGYPQGGYSQKGKTPKRWGTLFGPKKIWGTKGGLAHNNPPIFFSKTRGGLRVFLRTLGNTSAAKKRVFGRDGISEWREGGRLYNKSTAKRYILLGYIRRWRSMVVYTNKRSHTSKRTSFGGRDLYIKRHRGWEKERV